MRGTTNLQLLVEASWSAQGGVESMGPVCGPQDQQLTWVTLLEKQEKREISLEPDNHVVLCRRAALKDTMNTQYVK